MTTRVLNSDYPVTAEQIATYRRDGFIALPDVVTGDALVQLREAVENAVRAETPANDKRTPSEKSSYEQLFIQKVNLWRRHPAVREFVVCRRFGNLAARLSGQPARIWHDQALFKEAREGVRTPWHQDAHYWPHQQKDHQITIWIALRDVTAQNGCMSFIPGSHTVKDLPPINLSAPQDVFAMAPQLKASKPVTCALTAGSCTFHHGLTFHFAGPNRTDQMREAFAIIYIPDGTTLSGHPHVVTHPLNLKVGDKLEGDLFPSVSDKTG